MLNVVLSILVVHKLIKLKTARGISKELSGKTVPTTLDEAIKIYKKVLEQNAT